MLCGWMKTLWRALVAPTLDGVCQRISHISFTVPDVKALADELVSKGVQLAGPLEGFSDAQGQVSSIYAYDPDGILVQFDSGGGG